MSKAIEIKSGKIEAEYAREKLFNPLNITDWQWEKAYDGSTYGAFSLFLKPRDFAKVGQLLLQNGRWQGNQLIDEDYLSVATSHLVTNPSTDFISGLTKGITGTSWMVTVARFCL